jgi:hypothetical protein
MAYGDTRTYPATHDAVNAKMIEAFGLDPAYQTFTIHVGDWVGNGDSESDWSVQFFDPDRLNTREFLATMPINGCKGNHEGSGALFYKYWPYPYEDDFYWSFDYGPAHVIVIDQYVSYGPGSAQYNWLVNDLAGTDKQWIFLVFHEPGWSAGGHGNNSQVQNHIQPLCEQYGVDIVFAGHNHYYSRAVVNGVQHVTTGGGGAPLYNPDTDYPNIVYGEKTNHFCLVEIQGNTLTFSAKRLDGEVIDTFSMTGDILAGDFNNDGVVTLDDALLALKAVAGLASYPDGIADVNRDGRIGLMDVAYVLQIVAGLRSTD